MKNSTIQAAVAAFTVAATTLAGDIYVNDFATLRINHAEAQRGRDRRGNAPHSPPLGVSA